MTYVKGSRPRLSCLQHLIKTMVMFLIPTITPILRPGCRRLIAPKHYHSVLSTLSTQKQTYSSRSMAE